MAIQKYKNLSDMDMIYLLVESIGQLAVINHNGPVYDGHLDQTIGQDGGFVRSIERSTIFARSINC